MEFSRELGFKSRQPIPLSARCAMATFRHSSLAATAPVAFEPYRDVSDCVENIRRVAEVARSMTDAEPEVWTVAAG